MTLDDLDRGLDACDLATPLPWHHMNGDDVLTSFLTSGTRSYPIA